MTGFINPYNFFPLGEGCREQKRAEETVTGVIKYSILTKTPLFVPNTEVIFQDDVKDKDGNVVTDKNGKTKKHNYMVFNSLSLTSESGDSERPLSALNGEMKSPDQPMIPGSEVRGMIRSEYEMLTDSCLSVLNDDNILSKRIHAPFQAGLIKKNDNGYSLYAAEDCIFRADKTGSDRDAPADHFEDNKYVGYKDKNGPVLSYQINNYKTGDSVYFNKYMRRRGKPIAKELQNQSKNESNQLGYIMKGFPGPEISNDKKAEKHNLHIFTLRKNADEIKESIDIDALKTVVGMYLESGQKDNLLGNFVKEYDEQLRSFLSGNSNKQQYFPVYYSIVNDASGNEIDLFLSPSSITRELYRRKLGMIIDETHKPCSDHKKLCPACALFGRMDETNSVASRLRFSDPVFTGSKKGEKPEYFGETTLIPLSAPKISNMAFYLQKPDNAIFWTYDYYVTVDGQIKMYDKSINGRKFYWHHDNILTTIDKTDQNKTVYPLSEGNTFEGELYFDNISTTDLNRLIYIINCGETNTKLDKRKHGHKLGAGRPAGLGSIAAEVTSVFIRTANLQTYSCEKYSKYAEPDFAQKQKENYNTMTSFNSTSSGVVKYPCVEDNGDVFEWFSANHRGVNRDRNTNMIVPNREAKTIIDMPQKRNCELFVEHLAAMQTKTVRTPICLNKNDPTTESDEETAVLNGKANQSGRFVYFTVNGKRGSCKNTDLPVSLRNLDVPALAGKKIKVKYLGDEERNGRTYPKYQVIEEA